MGSRWKPSSDTQDLLRIIAGLLGVVLVIPFGISFAFNIFQAIFVPDELRVHVVVVSVVGLLAALLGLRFALKEGDASGLSQAAKEDWADRIVNEAEGGDEFSPLNTDQAAALRKLISVTIEVAHKEVAQSATRMQWLFFVSGLLFAVPLGVLGNYVYDYVVN